MPGLAMKLDNHERDTAEILRDHETRLRSVESKLWKMFGAIAVIAGAAPFIARLIP
jgi:hypothetical protein